MRNYKQRISLGPGKWAFEQDDRCASEARIKIRELLKLWSPPKHFFHLQRGGHIAAAKLHLNSDSFAKIDLRRFFEQVTRNRIIKRLTALGVKYVEAEQFAIASTVRHTVDRRRFVLPYGFVQSPLLASIDLDKSALGDKLRVLKKEGLRASVYVDDIIISSNDESLTVDGYKQLRDAVAQSNYQINEEKSQAPSTELRAFNLIMKPSFLQVDNERYSEFQAVIAMLGDCPETVAIVSYVESVNANQADRLLADFASKLRTAAGVIEKQRRRAAGL